MNKRLLMNKAWLLLLVCCALPAAAQPLISNVVHAATQVPRGARNYRFAPNTLVRISGFFLGPNALASRSLFDRLPLSLEGTSVEVTVGAQRYAAPVQSTHENVVYALIPNDAPLGTATLTVTYNGSTSNPSQSFPIVERAVGFFSLNGLGFGPVVALDKDLNLVSVYNPVNKGEGVILLGTGFGRLGAQVDAPSALAAAARKLTGERFSRSRANGETSIPISIANSTIPMNVVSGNPAGVGVVDAADIGLIASNFPNNICNFTISNNQVKLPVANGDNTSCGGPMFGTNDNELGDVKDKPEVFKVDFFRDLTPGANVLSSRTSRLTGDSFMYIDPPAYGAIHRTFTGNAPDPVYNGKQIPFGNGMLSGPGGSANFSFLSQFVQYQANLNSSFNSPGSWALRFRDTGLPQAGDFTANFPNVPGVSQHDIPSSIAIDGFTGFSVNVPPSSTPYSYWTLTLRTVANGVTNLLTKVFPGNSSRLEVTPQDLQFYFFSCQNTAQITALLTTPVPERTWVFAGGLTQVDYVTRVQDTASGTPTRYYNPLGDAFPPVTDTEAFATCP